MRYVKITNTGNIYPRHITAYSYANDLNLMEVRERLEDGTGDTDWDVFNEFFGVSDGEYGRRYRVLKEFTNNNLEEYLNEKNPVNRGVTFLYLENSDGGKCIIDKGATIEVGFKDFYLPKKIKQHTLCTK